MPRILIISMQDDPHVQAVTWGLRALGHEPTTWYWSDFPKTDSAVLRLGRDGAVSHGLRTSGAWETKPFDTVWVRRRDEPSPIAGTHPDDVDVVCKESERFFDNILPRLGHAGTRWVNHPNGDHRCRNKTTQLLTAQALGFDIPATLIGNDVDEVRRFFAAHPDGIVHKAFTPLHWDNEDGSRTAGRTSLITAAHLANPFSIRACPGIYQEKIEKRHELRVTVIGDTVLASMIDSQRDGPTIDWRCEGGRGVTNLRATTLQPALAQRCIALCRQLGLSFGCIDLIVTPEDQTLFVEINCAGQFLFNELADPDVPALDRFCRYLALDDTPSDEAARLTMVQFIQEQQAGQALRPVQEAC